MAIINEYKFESRDALFFELREDIISALSLGISGRDQASMLLSGGTTPGPLYQQLCEQTFDWKKVWVAPTDERWVEPDHDDSNEKLIRGSLLKNNAVDANYVGLKSNGDDPIAGQKATEQKLKNLPLPFDVVLLGMGEDGHVASLFPGLADTEDAMRQDNNNLCHAIRRGGDDVARMSMTLNALMRTKRIFLLFFGDKKLQVFEQAKRGKSEGLPVSYLLDQDKVPVSLYWAE